MKVLRDASLWVRENWPDLKSWDLGLGAVSFCVTGVVAASNDGVRENASTVLIAESALGVGLLAVVLTALAVLVTFFDDYYRQVLSSVPHGGGVMVAYQVVAFAGAATAVIGFVAAISWPVMPAALQAFSLGATTGLLTWATAGTLQLVNLTVFHGRQRAHLLEAVDEVRRKTARNQPKEGRWSA